MKASTVAAALVLSLAVTLASNARAAGQPQLPGASDGQSAQERMETKRTLDPQKYEKPQGSALRHQAAPSHKGAAQAKTEAVHPGGVGKAPTAGSESTGTAQASPSPDRAPLSTPGAVEAEHGSAQGK
jgi:hypothetical protein